MEKGFIGGDVSFVIVGYAGNVMAVCKIANIAKEQGKGRLQIINKKRRYYY